MTPVRIIGIGSSHGADQAGWLVADALQHSELPGALPAGMVSFSQCRFPAQLWQLVDGCDLAILIDAVCAEPGTVIEVDSGDLVRCKELHSTHGIGVGEALALIPVLTDQPPRVVLLGVGVNVEDGVCSVADVHRTLPRVRELIEAPLRALLQTSTSS
jgi:hydrogenase maturation protease